MRVNHDYIVNSARTAKEAGCRHFLMVSATDSDKTSRVTYRRVKVGAHKLLLMALAVVAVVTALIVIKMIRL